MSVLDTLWDEVIGGLDWLKGVAFGEFADHRSKSEVIADMLVSFVPGVIILTSARDMTAIILRLAKHPERREDLEEWMLLIACVVPLLIEGLMAVGGLVLGALAGSEAAAALRSVCLTLIRPAAELLEPLVGVLRKFVHGDLLSVLRAIHFDRYGEAIAGELGKFLRALDAIVKRVLAALRRLPYFTGAETIVERLQALEREFYAVQHSAVSKIPLALTELQARLTKALAETLMPMEHPALAGIPAGMPMRVEPRAAQVATMSANPLGRAEGLEPPPPMPGGVGSDTNLHPQTSREVEAERETKAYKMEEEKVPCFKGSKLSADKLPEMDRQLANQQTGLNQMTVQEYMDGRAAYQANGRGDPGVASDARERYQSALTRRLEDENVDAGMTAREAGAKADADAKQQMSTLAALHNPDQVAAGANVIAMDETGFGDRRVNSTIGGQWATNVKGTGKSRVGMLDDAAAQVPLEARATTKMNASLERCK